MGCFNVRGYKIAEFKCCEIETADLEIIVAVRRQSQIENVPLPDHMIRQGALYQPTSLLAFGQSSPSLGCTTR